MKSGVGFRSFSDYRIEPAAGPHTLTPSLGFSFCFLFVQMSGTSTATDRSGPLTPKTDVLHPALLLVGLCCTTRLTSPLNKELRMSCRHRAGGWLSLWRRRASENLLPLLWCNSQQPHLSYADKRSSVGHWLPPGYLLHSMLEMKKFKVKLIASKSKVWLFLCQDVN